MRRMHREELMAQKSIDGFLKKILTVVDAWETLRPNVLLFGMTVHQFKSAVMPSFTKRVEIEETRVTLRRLMAERDARDRHTSKMILRVVNAVKGMPEEGDDGELYAAMGYMTWTMKCEKARQAMADRCRGVSVQAAGGQLSQGDGECNDP
jgi:hypothetical protein